MAELARILYAVLVVGPPLSYLTWRSVRERKPVLLSGTAAVVVVAFGLPALVLPAVWLLLLVFMATCLSTFLLHALLSARLLFRSPRRHAGTSAANPPTIAVLIPARNEASVIRGCLNSVLRADYPANRLEVIVIDDGSNDMTPQLVAPYQATHRNVRLVVRPGTASRGKAAALNDVLFTLDSSYVSILDADHEVAGNFFRAALVHFDDPAVGGVQVRTVGRNWAENWLTRLMELEVLGWQYCFVDTKSRAGLFSPSFGSGCLFRTRLLQSIGGFDNDLATEDLEASFRLFEAGQRIVFCTATYTTNELVADLPGFFRQRYRWARGTTQAIPRHRRLFFGGGRTTLRQRLDLCLYPGLLAMMIAPFLQLYVHALSVATGVGLPYTAVVPAGYLGVIVVWHAVAGLRNRLEGQGMGPRRLGSLLVLTVGMYLHYGVLLAPALAKAFQDEFLLRSTFRPMKADHHGPIRLRRPARRHTALPEPPALQHKLLVVLGRQEPGAGPVTPVFDDADWPRVEKLAFANGVAGLFHAKLVGYGLESAVPPTVRSDFLAFRRQALARNLQLQNAWQAIARELESAGIEVIPLKGIHFIDRVYPPDVRTMYDIDLLVKSCRVAEAHRCLGALGYRALSNPTVNAKGWWTQRNFRCADTGVVIDLHWDLVNVYTYRQFCAYRAEEVWARASPSASRRLIFEMTPEDVVIHAAIHCAIHHDFVNLRQLVDLAEVLRAFGRTLDWSRLVELASAGRVRGAVHAALLMSRQLVGAPVPDAVLADLTPRLYRRMWLRWYLPRSETILDGEGATHNRPRWGLASVVLADSAADSLRGIRANLAFGLSAKGWDEV